MDLTTGAVHGVEALARWAPDRTDVPAEVFVGLAETHGLIHRLGRLVLEKALAQVASWRAAGHVLRVVAEGIETRAQARALAALEVPHAQGYLWARPQPAAAISELLPALVGT